MIVTPTIADRIDETEPRIISVGVSTVQQATTVEEQCCFPTASQFLDSLRHRSRFLVQVLRPTIPASGTVGNVMYVEQSRRPEERRNIGEPTESGWT